MRVISYSYQQSTLPMSHPQSQLQSQPSPLKSLQSGQSKVSSKLLLDSKQLKHVDDDDDDVLLLFDDCDSSLLF